MSGTKIVQNDIVGYTITYNRKKFEVVGDLNISSIKNIALKNGINLLTDLEKLKIQVEYSGGSKSPSNVSIFKYIEFITNDNYCLRGGKWFNYNEAYCNTILKNLKSVQFQNSIEDHFMYEKNELIEYAKINSILAENKKGVHPFETYYNCRLEKILNLNCIHPKTVPYSDDLPVRIEPCDLYDDNSLYFVKIGEPNDFAYAIEQANMTLDRIKKGNGQLVIDDLTILTPKVFVLVLVFKKRKSLITEWREIGSLNFLVHLAAFRRYLGEFGFDMKIIFSYNKETFGAA